VVLPTIPAEEPVVPMVGQGGTRARKVGIVALARKVLIDLWRFLEYGTIPEGAVLKA